MSERALAYSQEPLVHRFLVIYEAEGLQGGIASYLLRSLLTEGRLRYVTVEGTPEGPRERVIEREGPTGLITTTTAIRMHPENETRLFSIPVTAHVTISIFNILGQETARLVDEIKPAGSYSIVWNGVDSYGQKVSSGIYFYRLNANDYTESKKMALVQ